MSQQVPIVSESNGVPKTNAKVMPVTSTAGGHGENANSEQLEAGGQVFYDFPAEVSV